MPTYLLHLWRFFSQRVLKLGTDNFRIVLMFFSSVPESHALIARWKIYWATISSGRSA
jgi:hypothetical protein